jgi:formate dehydrogenase subunit gamma
MILRYGVVSRIAHWVIAIAYVFLFLSGLALFHPAFYWLAAVFGGGAVMRVLHPFAGAALFVLFFAYAAGLWRENLLLPSDRVWLKKGLAVMMKREEVPVQGKYNAGQKLMFWSMVLVIPALLASGIFIWRPYFAHLFTADTRRLAGVAHALFAFLMFVGIAIHVYAAYWTKGSISAMTRGYVSRAWAKFHHPGWYAEVTGERKDEKA